MAISDNYMTENQCYTRAVAIRPEYVVVHSTAVGYKSKDVLRGRWNNATIEKSCHGMVDDKGGIITLPLNYKGWHVGGTGNSRSVGFEICEPVGIAYANSAHSVVDKSKYNPADAAVRADFLRRYANAVEMAVYMCRETGIDADHVICHAEAHKLGIASNHADVNHWFPLFGKNMEGFRADVRARLGSSDADTLPPPAAAAAVYRVGTAWKNGKCVNQKGAFAVLKNAVTLCDKNPGTFVFDKDGRQVHPAVAPSPVTAEKDIYRVGTAWKNGRCVNQMGAFSVLKYAVTLCGKNPGTFVFDKDGRQVYPR